MLLMVLAAVLSGVLLHRLGETPPWGELIVVSTITITSARLLAERQQMYSLEALLDPMSQLQPLALSMLGGGALAIASLALLHEGWPSLPYLLTQPAAWALSTSASLLAFRSVVANRLQRHRAAGRLSTRVALVGANASSLAFINGTEGDASVRVVGIFDDRMTRLELGTFGRWLRGSVEDLVASARQQPIDAIVICLPLSAKERIAAIRGRLAGIATDVFLATEVDTSVYAGGRFTHIGGGPVISVSVRPLKDWPAFKKAAFDRVLGSLFLLFALPLMVVIALAVGFTSRGTILFRQEREGLNGAPFTLLKFRTMYERTDADESVQATRRDRRVTPVGYWLRRLSLDELPQLWNVVRGDMSLVGPRPHLATTRANNRLFHEIVPHYQARHRMKPGLTGWAQVQGLRGETRTERDVVERVAQDLHYIDNWSLALDLKIIFRTIAREIFSSSGRAY